MGSYLGGGDVPRSGSILFTVDETNTVSQTSSRQAREKHSALDALSLVSNHTDTLVCHLKFNSEIFTPSGTDGDAFMR